MLKGPRTGKAAQMRTGARLRSRSSSGQADKIAVVFILENSCDVPTTPAVCGSLTAFRKKMQPDAPLTKIDFLLQKKELPALAG
jgi:hypothetical protein